MKLSGRVSTYGAMGHGLIVHGGLIELFLVPASVPRLL